MARQVVTPGRTFSVDSLFREAELDHASGRLGDAAGKYRKVYDLDPRGPLARGSLFRAASIEDERGEHERALEGYEAVYQRFPQQSEGTAALVRAMRLLVHLERWGRAGEAADILLTRFDELAELAKVATFAAKALALLALNDDESALYFVEKGRSLLENLGVESAGKLPVDAAALYFALAEARRIRAGRITFDPVPAEFAAVLERRCQLLLDAQSAYSTSMRAYDAHWSAMAGYRVGELYHSLHEDLMRIPAPTSATDSRSKQLFEGAMRLRYQVLLQKALSMMQQTLAMAERTGEKSVWVERARGSSRVLEVEIRREQEAIDALGYRREELEAALQRLAEKARANRPTSGRP